MLIIGETGCWVYGKSLHYLFIFSVNLKLCEEIKVLFFKVHYRSRVDLFIIVPNWKQSRYPSTGEWINNLGIHAMANYSAVKEMGYKHNHPHG